MGWFDRVKKTVKSVVSTVKSAVASATQKTTAPSSVSQAAPKSIGNIPVQQAPKPNQGLPTPKQSPAINPKTGGFNPPTTASQINPSTGGFVNPANPQIMSTAKNKNDANMSVMKAPVNPSAQELIAGATPLQNSQINNPIGNAVDAVGNLLIPSNDTGRIGAGVEIALGIIPGGKSAKALKNLLKTKAARQVTKDLIKANIKTNFKLNSKNRLVAKTLLEKMLSNKALKWGALTAAAGSVFLSLWGDKESGEPLSITMRDIGYEARQTGNYSLYWEAAEVRDEIINLPFWAEIGKYIPFVGPFISIPNAIKGVAEAAVYQDKFMEQSESGLTPDQIWANSQAEERQADMDYRTWSLNQQAIFNENERQANAAAHSARNKEDAKAARQQAEMWAEFARQQREAEAKDREAQAQFWIEYRKFLMKMQQDNAPSNLKFGLL